MRVVFGACALVLGLLAGCRSAAPAPAPARQVRPTVTPVRAEIPLSKPTRVEPNLDALAKTPVKQASANTGTEYRRLTEAVCQGLAAQNTPPANALDEEGRAPAGCDPQTDKLKQTLRFCAALELRNRSAADALERFFQLAGTEGRTDVLRDSFPVTDDLQTKAKGARAANVRFPLDPADLERRRTELRALLEQAEAGSELLNIDLKRRLGLAPLSERLWPGGDFGVETDPVDAEQEVRAARADRPELRGLRTLHAGLTPDTLTLAREQLRASNPLLGAAPAPVPARGLSRFLHRNRGPSAETLAELELRKQQLAALIETRERAIADEARAAVVSLNAQARRVQLARDRLDIYSAQRADATKKREANQPGAELLEAQVTLEWLQARGEVIAEVMAWHTARVRLKAAKGWLAWECLGAEGK